MPLKLKIEEKEYQHTFNTTRISNQGTIEALFCKPIELKKTINCRNLFFSNFYLFLHRFCFEVRILRKISNYFGSY